MTGILILTSASRADRDSLAFAGETLASVRRRLVHTFHSIIAHAREMHATDVATLAERDRRRDPKAQW